MQAQTTVRAMRPRPTDRKRTPEARRQTIERRRVRAWKAGRS